MKTTYLNGGFSVSETPDEIAGGQPPPISDFRDQASRYAQAPSPEPAESPAPTEPAPAAPKQYRQRSRLLKRGKHFSLPRGVIHNALVESVMVWPGFWTITIKLADISKIPISLTALIAGASVIGLVIFLANLEEALRKGIERNQAVQAIDYCVELIFKSRRLCVSVGLSLVGFLIATFIA